MCSVSLAASWETASVSAVFDTDDLNILINQRFDQLFFIFLMCIISIWLLSF